MAFGNGKITGLNPGAIAPRKLNQQKPSVTHKEPSPSAPAPKESFTASQKVVAALPKAAEAPSPETKLETPAEKPQLKIPRPGSDMARMVENIDAVDRGGNLIELGAGGSLVVLQDGSGSGYLGYPLETQIQEVLQHPVTQHGEAHVHEHGPEGDALLGGHLATEVVEKIGHSAHHGAEHASHVVSEAAQSSGAEALDVLVDAKSEVGHTVAESLTNSSRQAAAEASNHGVDAGHDTVSELGELVHDAVHEAGHETGKAVGHLSTGLSTALAVSAGASGILGVAFLGKGVKEGVEGLKEGSVEKMAEGVGGVAVGTRSLAAATVMGSMVSGSAVLADVASVASKTLTPLGIVHGAVDIGLGVKDLVEKKPVDGMLKIGLGTSITAGALVGGLPLTFLALGFVGAKVGRSIYQSRKAKKTAAEEAVTQQQGQVPTTVTQTENEVTIKEPTT